MNEITARNVATLLQTIRTVERQVAELVQTMQQQSAAVATIQGRLTELEHSVALARIARLGAGPTV